MNKIFSVAASLFLTALLPLASAQEATPASTVSANALAAPTNTASVPDVTTPEASPAAVPVSNPACCDSMAEQKSIPPVASGAPSYRTYSSVHVDGNYIAIAFDDGPSATLTPRLLDILKERGIKVTFFVIGENAARNPQILAREVAEGHEVGNHTWDHPQLTKLSDTRVQEELNKTSDVIFQATGKKPVLLRPPYGAINPRLTHMIQDQDGMKIVLWSVDPQDWKRPGSAVVSQRLLAGAKPGAILLAHDIHPGTIEAMPATLDALLAKGYKFVTVSELIAMESKTPQPAATATPVASKSHKKKHANKS
jgi:peptidoglycan/xylan/chitin deacetylase (PgdA/CDA1 family)